MSIVADAISNGYPIAAGHLGESASGQLMNPAAFFAALRDGRTLAEAVSLASPKHRSTIRVIGDPLATVTFPRQGYNIYSRPTLAGEDTLIAVAPVGAASIDLAGFEADTEQFVQIRAVNKCGQEDNDPLRLRRVAFDGTEFIEPVPNAPIDLQLIPAAGGEITAQWSYRTNGQQAEPATFRIYVAIENDGFDFDDPDVTIAANSSNAQSVSIGTFDHETRVRAVIRAVAATGAEEQNTREATAIADTQAPTEPGLADVEVTSE